MARPEILGAPAQYQEQGLKESILRSKPVMLAVTALTAVGVGYGAEKADASPVSTTVTEMTTDHNVLVGSSSETVKSAAKAIIVSNHRTVSKAEIKEAKQDGQCEYFTGKQAVKEGFQTQGYMGTGTGFAQENRGTTACDTNNDGRFDTRAECGNALIARPPKPEKAKNTIWVNNKNVAKIVVKSKSVATAKADCELTTENGSVSASAFGRGVGYARAAVRVRAAMKAKGNGVHKLVAKSSSSANASARSFAHAKAVVKCKQQGGEVVPPTPPIPPVNNKPECDVVDQAHSVEEDVVRVNMYASDPDGLQDIKHVSLTESGDGEWITGLKAGNEPGEYYKDLSVGPIDGDEGEVSVTCTVTDQAGAQGTNTESWPVVKVNNPL